MQAAPQRRIYRRIKRDSQSGKDQNRTQAPVTAPLQTGNKPLIRPSPNSTPLASKEPPRTYPPGTRLYAEVKPMPAWGTVPVYDIRPSVLAEHNTDEPVLLTEESSTGSRVNSKKRSAPTTLVNTPQMLQQLAKEGSTGDSSCCSSSLSSAASSTSGSDESDDSEPDVVARHQHPFGTQNGLPTVSMHSSSATAPQRSLAQAHAQALLGAGLPLVPRLPSPPPSGVPNTAAKARSVQPQPAGLCPHPVKGGTFPLNQRQAAGNAGAAKPVSGGLGQEQAPLKASPGGRQMLDMVDTFGRAPLHVAAAAGRVDIVQQLLFGGCDYTKSLQADFRQV